ncbi:MAG: aminoglycoside phosphotransferase family protein [Alphaproteobacteria bacterium]|nr:aminoglycoside phosphotransferase family protein [Alphaproteobacteria bacterium]
MIKAENKNTHEPDITPAWAARLVAEQFPQWADLPIRPVRRGGVNNQTFHLGQDKLIRMPRAERYAAQVNIEQEWLPVLAQSLSCPIPEPLGMGKPSQGYPWHWSIYKWIEGENADTLKEPYQEQFAIDSAQFLNALYKVDATKGPLAGGQNFYRGASPAIYDKETRNAVARLKGVVDSRAAIKVWEKALASKWERPPVWVHGDFSSGNILVKEEKLAAVIDFGCAAVGDPACDLVIAWTFLTDAHRDTFKSHVQMDADTWARARGWCLWKALITLAKLQDKNDAKAAEQHRIINAVLCDV